jgi:hypothetical protein
MRMKEDREKERPEDINKKEKQEKKENKVRRKKERKGGRGLGGVQPDLAYSVVK